MNRLLGLLPLTCFFPLPKVMGKEIQCPSQNTLEMRYCASLDREKYNENFRSQLPLGTFDRWKQMTKEVFPRHMPLISKALFTRRWSLDAMTTSTVPYSRN